MPDGRKHSAKAIPLHQVQHMAMGPQVTNTNKPRHPLARHGAREPRPTKPNAPGPDRALMHLTMKSTAQLPTALEGEKHFIVEGVMDDVLNLVTHTLAAVPNTWDDAVGYPTEGKDRIQEKEDILTPEIVDELVQRTSPPQQHVQRIVLKVTDCTVLGHPSDTPTITLMCHQHTLWAAEWDGKGTATRVQTYTPKTPTATTLALEDRFRQSAHHTNHPLAHWLALKTAMHWTVDAPATDTTLPTTWLTLAHNVAAYVRRHWTTQTQRWMSWPTDTEQNPKLRTASRQTQTNKMRGVHGPREGRGPSYSIFQGTNAPKPAPHPAPEPV